VYFRPVPLSSCARPLFPAESAGRGHPSLTGVPAAGFPRAITHVVSMMEADDGVDSRPLGRCAVVSGPAWVPSVDLPF